MNHKINQIKRLIESLDPYEIKELTNYLMEEESVDVNDYGELPETKELLMKSDDTGWSVAHSLAENSNETGWATNDKEILMLQDKSGWSVAHLLAWYHPTWTTDDQDILKLRTKTGKTVEDLLKKRGKI